jgi:MFS family permease
VTPQRRHVEHRAALLFVGASLVMAVVCGAIIVSGWFAGGLQDRWERIFWAGAILSFVTLGVLAAAAFPAGADEARAIRRVTRLTRLGLVLFMLAPTLCLVALILDFYA